LTWYSNQGSNKSSPLFRGSELLCRNLFDIVVDRVRMTTVKATITFGQILFQWFVLNVVNATVFQKIISWWSIWHSGSDWSTDDHKFSRRSFHGFVHKNHSKKNSIWLYFNISSGCRKVFFDNID
jgi:hypothetical protein